MQSEGKPTYDIRIVGNNEIIMFIVPLTQMPDKLTPEMLEKLDELNGRYFFVKFVHDKTSVYMRIDALLHSIDGLVIQAFVNALSLVVDKDAGDLIDLISKGATSKSKSK